jgi:hypothetical protein
MRHEQGSTSTSPNSDLPELGWPRRVAKSWGWSLVLFVVWLILLGDAASLMAHAITVPRLVFLVATVVFLIGSAVGTVNKLRARHPRRR